MGDPRKNRKKYSKPSHPWEKERIDIERELLKEYALKNKTELWKMKAPLDHYKNRVKAIISKSGADEESGVLILKLQSLGLVGEGAKLDDVLSLNVKDILERRLQTVLFRKGMARSVQQARQFITHQHVTVDGQKISSPAYVVSLDEESKISFSGTSSLSNPDHPELSFERKSEPEPEKKEPDKKAEKKEDTPAEKKEKHVEKKVEKKEDTPAKKDVKQEAKE